MSDGNAALLVLVLVFCVVVLVSYAAMNGLARRGRLRQRYGAVSAAAAGRAPQTIASSRRLLGLTPAQLGVAPSAQRRLRNDLIRAGFFAPDGVVLFTIARWTILVALPLLAVVFLTGVAAEWSAVAKAAFSAAVLLVAYYLPTAFLARRQRVLQDRYRVVFPEFLDMLVVCVNAGLSLEAALDRVTRELGPDDAELRANLELMAGEMRAGKRTVDALKDCADRLGLAEARSFATLLQQSIELGTDVALALTTFSDEMRDKRMVRAEEKAASLPPKLTLPLGAFIFPVVLIVVLTPVVLKIMRAVGT